MRTGSEAMSVSFGMKLAASRKSCYCIARRVPAKGNCNRLIYRTKIFITESWRRNPERTPVLRVRKTGRCRPAESEHPAVAAGDCADHGEQAHRKQHPVKPLDAAEGAFRVAVRALAEPVVQEERFGDEKHDGEQR